MFLLAGRKLAEATGRCVAGAGMIQICSPTSLLFALRTEQTFLPHISYVTRADVGLGEPDARSGSTLNRQQWHWLEWLEFSGGGECSHPRESPSKYAYDCSLCCKMLAIHHVSVWLMCVLCSHLLA